MRDLHAVDRKSNVRELHGHEGSVDSVTISLDGRWLATGSRDKTAIVWDLAAEDPNTTRHVFRPIHVKSEYSRAGITVQISPDSHWLVTKVRGGDKLEVWDLTDENPMPTSHLVAPAVRSEVANFSVNERCNSRSRPADFSPITHLTSRHSAQLNTVCASMKTLCVR